jgi:hypothetical protein
MSLDTILNDASMAGVRAKLATLQATELLKHVYPGYDGYLLPHEREEYFQLRIGGYPHYFWDLAEGIEVKAYITGLCHAIWVEETVQPRWSLKDYAPRQLQFLLDRTVNMDGWGPHRAGMNGCWGYANSRSPVPRDPVADEWYKAFPLSFSLVGRNTDQATAALRMVSWVTANFYHHYHGGHDYPWYIPYQRRADGWGTWLDEYFHERSVGCHATGKILAALLRSVNIPAQEIHHGGHGICYLPTLERYVHGDLMANLTLLSDNGRLLMSLSELTPYLPKPPSASESAELAQPTGWEIEAPVIEGLVYVEEDGILDHEDYIEEIQDQDPLALVRLRRRGWDLFLAGVHSPADSPDELPPLPVVPGSDVEAALRARLPQFGVYQDGRHCYSRRVRIRELRELPECGLTLEVHKDAAGWIVVALENRGYALTEASGTLHVEVDGSPRAAIRLTEIDPAYLKGGGQTLVNPHTQLAPDEVGLVRVRLEGLTAPCGSVEVQRHLGQPLQIDPPGPLDPIVVEPIP